KRRHRAVGLATRRADLDFAAGRGGEHHQPHDRHARDRAVLLGHGHGSIELTGQLHEARRGACVETFLIDDRNGAGDLRRSGGRPLGGGRRRRIRRRRAHFTSPASSCEATLMYLRPASRAEATASGSFSVLRTLASLISIGRFMPAITSIFARSMIEIARLDGVPPNMSVSTTTPEPSSTPPTWPIISRP